ncbi:MAG: Maf family nucleotide pyrophosphatase [Bacteroidales bacterium]|nr:Maf family nucleotide pyrophosphatase [Bacteroidales bacterium]
MADSLNRYRIILASGSPRRKQLLEDMGLKFEVIITSVPEEGPPELEGRELAMHVAAEKARILKPGLKKTDIVIAADTIVWCNDTLLGKPEGIDDAAEMLRSISGRTHEVITGVCIMTADKEILFSDSTKVTFGKLTDEEIYYYIDNYKPYDKAGAYGIQEWIGYIGCRRIEGSYFNVMGLPVQRLYRELQRLPGSEGQGAGGEA